MSLLSDFAQDVTDSIFDAGELAAWREVGVSDGAGGIWILKPEQICG
jgi:hypothetical protein